MEVRPIWKGGERGWNQVGILGRQSWALGMKGWQKGRKKEDDNRKRKGDRMGKETAGVGVWAKWLSQPHLWGGYDTKLIWLNIKRSTTMANIKYFLPRKGTSQVFAKASPPPFEKTLVHSYKKWKGDKEWQIVLTKQVNLVSFSSLFSQSLFNIFYWTLCQALLTPWWNCTMFFFLFNLLDNVWTKWNSALSQLIFWTQKRYNTKFNILLNIVPTFVRLCIQNCREKVSSHRVSLLSFL